MSQSYIDNDTKKVFEALFGGETKEDVEEQMETLKGQADVTTLSSDADPNPVTADGNPGGIFTRAWTVSNPLGGSTSRRVNVTVSWKRQGGNRSVVLTSITRGNGT